MLLSSNFNPAANFSYIVNDRTQRGCENFHSLFSLYRKMKKRKSYFLKYMITYSYFLLGGIVCACLLHFAIVWGNSVISSVIDDMLAGQEIILMDFLPRFILLMLAGFALAFIKQLFLGAYCVRVSGTYRKCVVEKLYRTEYAYLKSENSATVINKLNADIAETENLLSTGIPQIIMDVAALIIYSAYVGSLNVSLLLLIFATYPLVFWIAGKMVKKIRALTGTYRVKSDVMTGIAQDVLSGILVLRSFGLEEHFQEKMHRAAVDLVDNEEQRTRISNNAMLVRKMIQWMPTIICAVYAVVLVGNGALSIGGLLAFVVTLGRLAEAFVGIPFDFVETSVSLVSIRRIEEILHMPDEVGGTQTEGRAGTDVVISLQDICFGYSGETFVLNGLNLCVRAGEHIALVGESGGGKSTIFHLLCAFYRAGSGSYQLYGREIAEWDLQAARARFALVSQDVFLFPTTVEENIAYGNWDASHKEIVEACKKAQIHDFIMTLPQGYQTLVGERGAMLSGGQKQRISIARAILKNAPVLLLDEPTSAIDVETEELIQHALDHVMKGRTCITIAHRLSTVRNADCIYVVSDGKIAECGTHESLLAANGVYAKLYEQS